jgi:hypothetical protein
MWRQRVTTGGVYSLAFSADGMTVYTGDGRGWIAAWEVERGVAFDWETNGRILSAKGIPRLAARA